MLEDRNMAGEMVTPGPQRSSAEECSLTFRWRGVASSPEPAAVVRIASAARNARFLLRDASAGQRTVT